MFKYEALPIILVKNHGGNETAVAPDTQLCTHYCSVHHSIIPCHIWQIQKAKATIADAVAEKLHKWSSLTEYCEFIIIPFLLFLPLVFKEVNNSTHAMKSDTSMIKNCKCYRLECAVSQT